MPKPRIKLKLKSGQIPSSAVVTDDRLMRMPAVLASLAMPRTTFDDLMRQGRVPQPLRLGKRFVAWRKSDIEKVIKGEWEQTQPVERASARKAA